MKQTTFDRAKDRSLLWILLAALTVLLIGLTAHAQTTQPAPVFTLGVFQPDEVPVDGAGHNATQTWAARGVNTAVGLPKGHDPDGFDWRCTLSGLRVVRSLVNGVVPKNLPNGLYLRGSAICFDEPDLNAPDKADALVDEYLGTGPTYQNVCGGAVLGLQGGWDDATYRRVLARYTVVGTDIYPVTGWGRPDKLRWVYDAQVKLAALAPSATRWACIECSDQRLPNVAGRTLPNRSEVVAESYLALIGGAKGLVWFPQCIGAWSFDATTADTQAAIADVTATCTRYADFLNRGSLRVTAADPKFAGQWTLNGQVLTIGVDLSTVGAPASTVSLAGVAASSSSPPPPATTQATTAPTTKPSVPVAQAQLKRWLVLSRDYNHKRVVLTWVDARGKVQTTLITDPATIAAIDAAAGK